MIHGLRNDRSGALAKYVIAQKRLKTLHYNNPVIGYSYDSNTAGVQYKSTAISALKTGLIIAQEKPDAILPTMGGQTALNLAKVNTCQ